MLSSAHQKLLQLCLCVSILICSCLSIRTGAFAIDWQDFFQSIIQPDSQSTTALIIHEIRLPRTLLCLCMGALLALCGAIMQCLFKNPLADPGLMGVSAGASLGAALAIMFFSTFLSSLPIEVRTLLIPISAFMGSWLITLLIYNMGKVDGQVSVSMMLLAGIAVNAFVGAIIGYLTYLSTDDMLRNFSMWSMGSLSGADNHKVIFLWIVLIALFVYSYRNARLLNALLLGDQQAEYLGIRLKPFKRSLIIFCALGVSTAISMAGMIGFVGLIVPHISRFFVGADHKKLLPLTFLLGALLLIVADIISRIIIIPSELPIGIVMAFIGAPFFLYLLIQSKGSA